MRLLLAGLLTTVSTVCFSQDLSGIRQLINSNDYLSAKKRVDSFFLLKKNADATAWYYKGKVYTEVTRQHQGFNYELLKEAFAAYKKSYELDGKVMQSNNHVDLFQLFDLSYDKGIDYYNEQDYALAFHFFQVALDAEEFIYKKGFSFQGKSFPGMDTSLINLVGSAAYLSKREEEAIPYFERLANTRIAGEEYKPVYVLLYQYYTRKKDGVKAAKYLNAGKEIFPDKEYWIKMELGNLVVEKDRFARYDQLVQQSSSDLDLLMNYVVELFNYVYADKPPADYKLRQDKLQSLLAKALVMDPNSALANFVMSQHLYNQVYEMEELYAEMKENTPAEEAKKKAFGLKLDQKYEELLSYGTKAFDLYAADVKGREKCHKLCNQIIACYQRKKQGDKVNYWKEKLKDF